MDDFGFPDIREVCTCGIAVVRTTVMTCVAVWFMLAHAGIPRHRLFRVLFFRLFWHCCVCRHSQGRLIHHVAYDGIDFCNFCFGVLWLGNKMQSPTVDWSYMCHTWTTRLQSLTSVTLTFFTRQSRKVDSYQLFFALLVDQCDIARNCYTCTISYSVHVRLSYYRCATTDLYYALM